MSQPKSTAESTATQSLQRTDQIEYRRRQSHARYKSRRKYWKNSEDDDGYDKEEYRCPDCQRGSEEVREFHVHHIDGNVFHIDDRNLIGLCYTCHHDRHGNDTSRQTLDEWQEEFLALGNGD